MGMDFTGPAGHVGLSLAAFATVFELARLYGWRPAGAVAIDEYDFVRRCEAIGYERAVAEAKGDPRGQGQAYFSNDWKLITAAEAGNFAAALRRALDDLDPAAWKRKGLPDRRHLMEFVLLLESGPIVGS